MSKRIFSASGEPACVPKKRMPLMRFSPLFTRGGNVKNPTKNVTKQLGFLSIRLSHICLIFVGKSVLRRGPSLNFHGLEYQNNPEPLPKPFEACTR